MYAVTASMTTDRTGWTYTRQLPTFYLDASVQGIVSVHHAVQIARSILDPFGDHGIRLHVTVVEL